MTDNPIDEAPPCIRGCIRKGTDQPLPARHGPYCNRCYYQLVRALQLAAELVEHIVSLISYQSHADEDKVTVSREAPVPFNLEAFHDANEIFRDLRRWARVWAARLGEPAPRLQGKVWRDGAGRVVGFSARVPVEVARRQTAEVSRWLLNRIDTIFELVPKDPTVARLVDVWRDGDGVTRGVRSIYTVNARWPRDPQPRYSDMPCPDDNGRVAVFPPAEFGDDERIVCEKCGRHFEPDHYEFYIRVFQQQKKEEQRTARTARHLFRKFIEKPGGAV